MPKETKTESTKKDSKKIIYKVLSKEEKNKIATLEIEVPFSELATSRDRALKMLGKEIEIKGFRKGMAPTKILEEQIGEMKIVEEMAYQTIIKVLPTIVEEEKINALTQPKISITKIAKDNPLTFKADFVLMPDIKLADYKKIAKEIKPLEEIKIDEKEVEDYIDYIRNSRAESEALRKKTSADPKEREEANQPDKKVELPEFNDDFVKTLGDFKDVADFKKQLSENMRSEKEEKARQKRRLEIVEKIISDSEIDLPDLLIEEELHRMLDQFKGDLASSKIDFEEYLKQIKKTHEDILKEWRPDAIKRTKMNLILPKIAFEEKIEADAKKVEHEVAHLKHHHPDIDDEHAKSYVSYMLRNDAVFKFLEEIK